MEDFNFFSEYMMTSLDVGPMNLTCLSTTPGTEGTTNDVMFRFHEAPDRQPTKSTAGPSSSQWASIKDVFTRLYIVENRKLKDVKEILSKEHGFRASEKMYKRRITDWKIHKNYKAKEKEILARRVKACVDAGNDVRSISFHGRPLKLDRVKRHCRSDKILARLWEHLSQSPELDEDVVIKGGSSPITSIKPTSVQSSNKSPSPPDSEKKNASQPRVAANKLSIQIGDPDSLHAVHATLIHTREAIDWQFTAFTRLKLGPLQGRFPESLPGEVLMGQVDQASAFWLSLYHGYTALKTGRSAEAWKTLDNSCKMVQPLLFSAPLQLLSCLLLHFATPWDVGLNTLEQHLLHFVSSMASNVMSPHHPLAKALRLVATAKVREHEHAVETMMHMIVEGYTTRRKASNSSLFALRIDQIDMLRKRRKFEQARFLCQRIVKDGQLMGRKRHRTALAALGRLYADQKEEYALEGVAQRILDEERVDDPMASDSGGTTSWAHYQLANLSMNRGDHKLAEVHLRRAIAISYRRYLHRGPSTRSLLGGLQTCLSQQGRDVEIGTICEEMSLQLALVDG
ncbi:hypothetical protein LTR41_000322 [Exophiala xenobiotica]|nr:hypothetical protein LTR41_000322 [Exophiala xenobiotica]